MILEESKYSIGKSEPFNCKIKVLGRPQCEVEWTKNGTAWWEYARYGGGFAQVAIPSTQGVDSGEYIVTAKNRAGSAKATIHIQVIGSYPPLTLILAKITYDDTYDTCSYGELI